MELTKEHIISSFLGALIIVISEALYFGGFLGGTIGGIVAFLFFVKITKQNPNSQKINIASLTVAFFLMLYLSLFLTRIFIPLNVDSINFLLHLIKLLTVIGLGTFFGIMLISFNLNKDNKLHLLGLNKHHFISAFLGAISINLALGFILRSTPSEVGSLISWLLPLPLLYYSAFIGSILGGIISFLLFRKTSELNPNMERVNLALLTAIIFVTINLAIELLSRYFYFLSVLFAIYSRWIFTFSAIGTGELIFLPFEIVLYFQLSVLGALFGTLIASFLFKIEGKP